MSFGTKLKVEGKSRIRNFRMNLKALTFLKFPGLIYAIPTAPNSDGSSRCGISVVSQIDVLPSVGHINATR